MNESQHDAIAVIIGRAGSKGLPGKNSRLVAGLPMVAHAIGHARSSRHVRQVVVSTDGEEIARAARATGTDVVMRPPLLAGDTASVDCAVRHAVESLGVSHRIVVILYANVPVRPPGLVDRAVEHLVSTGADSVQSYESVGKKHPWWMSRMDESGRIVPWHRNDVYRRQDLPAVVAAAKSCTLSSGGALPQTVRQRARTSSGTHLLTLRSNGCTRYRCSRDDSRKRLALRRLPLLHAQGSDRW